MNNEQLLIDSMANILQEKMVEDYAKGQIKRDGHPKSLGFLKGKFKVESNLPEHLAKGVFIASKEYECLIRLSSASGKIQSDKLKDLRGFAIKLLDVEGERFTNKEKHTQDFILLSFPFMPLGTIKLFHDAVYYSIKSSPLLLLLKFIFTGNAKKLAEINKAKQNQSSSLDIRYWSTTPYQFNTTYVKYSLKPTSSYKSKLESKLTENYLTENNAKHLQESEATFDFCLQFYQDEKNTPIEDAGVNWDEKISPFIKVATLTIAKQNISTLARKDLAETISFSPANCLKVHQPVGGINRARIQIYERLSAFRTKQNNKEFVEADPKLYNDLI